jgi:hypothetical protein
MHAAGIVDLVCEVLLCEDLSHHVTPPVRNPLADVPEEIAIDDGDSVEEIGGTAVSDKPLPVGRMPTVAGHRNAKLSAEVGGKLLGMIVEDWLAEQRADAMPRSAAILREISRPHVQIAESFPRHTSPPQKRDQQRHA